MAYVYRMQGKENKTIYIGKSQNIKNRMGMHYGKNEWQRNLPKEAYEEIEGVVYTETKTLSDAIILEAYLIAKEKPKYNKEYVVEDELTIEIDVSGYEWMPYMDEIGNEHHRIYVWRGKELIYEIPMDREVYTLLSEELRLHTPFEMQYGTSYSDNGYRLMKHTNKHKTAVPKYKFMGYPELSEWQIRGHR